MLRTAERLTLAVLLLVAPACGGGGPGADPAAPVAMAFVHRVAAENWELRAGSATVVGTAFDEPASNGRPDRILHVNGGFFGAPIVPTVYYDADAERWGVLYPSSVTAAPDPAVHIFGVLVREPGPDDFVHTALPSNIDLNYTHVSHPLLDANPSAILLVTNRSTDATPARNVGVFFDTPTGMWAIFNEDRSNLAVGTEFNVSVLNDHPDAFLHTTNAGNVRDDHTVISHPLTNGHSGDLVLGTHVWNPAGASSGPYNNHPIVVGSQPGVILIGSEDLRAAVLNQSAGPGLMPEGAGFNLIVLRGDFLPDPISGGLPPRPGGGGGILVP